MIEYCIGTISGSEGLMTDLSQIRARRDASEISDESSLEIPVLTYISRSTNIFNL